MMLFSKPVLIATVASGLLAIQACSTSGNANVRGRVGPVEVESTVTWEPENKGTKIGFFIDGTTGKVYDLYDIDGDGMPDVANERGTKRWYKIDSITLIPIGDEPTVIIRSRNDPERAAGNKSANPPIFDVEGGTLELSPSTLGAGAFLTDANGAVHVTLPFNPDFIGNSINFNSESDLAGSVFDFNGYTEAQILAQYGWVNDGDDNYTIPSYSDLIADGDTDQDDLHAFFVFASGVSLPNLADYDLAFSIVPGNEWDDQFSCYGIAISGNIYAISAFASDVGINQLTITDDTTGITVVTTLDAQTRTATSTILGIPYDSYSY